MRRFVGPALIAVVVAASCSSSHKAIPFAPPTTGAPENSSPLGAKPTAAFTKVAEGTNDGLHWRLSQAPGSKGTQCFKLETGPSVDLIQSEIECPNPPTATATPDFNTEFPFETGGKTDHAIVVGVARHPIKDAEFQFVVSPDANPITKKPVYIDKTNGIVVWAGKSQPFLGSLQMTLDDNSKIDCGPGDIQSAAQLSGKSQPDVLKALQFVWSCIVDVQ